MESEYTELIGLAQSFIDLLDHTKDESGATDADEPHVEQIDFDRLREMLAAVQDKLNAAQKVEGEMRWVRRRLAARITALRRGRRIIADNGRPVEDSFAADELSLDELVCMQEEEMARLHRTASSERTVRGRRAANRDYGEFK